MANEIQPAVLDSVPAALRPETGPGGGRSKRLPVIRPARRRRTKRSRENTDPALQFIINPAHLPPPFELIGRESKARKHDHENQAIPDLQPPFDGFENHTIRRTSYASPISKLSRTRITRPSDGWWFSFSFNAIAVAAAGGDEFRAELFADVGDVNVQQVGKRAFVFVEQMLVKLRARDDFAPMQREKFHQRIFARGQFDRFVLERNIPRRGVNFHVADFDDVRGLVRAAADERAQAGEQFRQIERLDHVIVRAGVEALARGRATGRAR